MKGYMGKMLVVNLTERRIESQAIPEEWFEQYVGGEGLAMRFFNDLVQPGKDVLDPAQPLIFATGPLTGTLAPCSGRCVVVFWSPATKTIGASNGGGDFAPTLKRAGWDMLVVTGRADTPVCLVIDNDKAEIQDASYLWGKTVTETEDYL